MPICVVGRLKYGLAAGDVADAGDAALGGAVAVPGDHFAAVGGEAGDLAVGEFQFPAVPAREGEVVAGNFAGPCAVAAFPRAVLLLEEVELLAAREG